jgi:hypothetical protein
MGLLFLLFFNASAWADARLELRGTVRPAFDFALTPFGDGFAVKNTGNAIVLFQIGARDRQGRQVAWLRQNEQLLLRTDYAQSQNAPVEIRILAP